MQVTETSMKALSQILRMIFELDCFHIYSRWRPLKIVAAVHQEPSFVLDTNLLILNMNKIHDW